MYNNCCFPDVFGIGVRAGLDFSVIFIKKRMTELYVLWVKL